jgi:hypothetical protein
VASLQGDGRDEFDSFLNEGGLPLPSSHSPPFSARSSNARHRAGATLAFRPERVAQLSSVFRRVQKAAAAVARGNSRRKFARATVARAYLRRREVGATAALPNLRREKVAATAAVGNSRLKKGSATVAQANLRREKRGATVAAGNSRLKKGAAREFPAETKERERAAITGRRVARDFLLAPGS